MAHVAKYTKEAAGHLLSHYERKKDDNGEYIKFGNQDIDTSRSHLNYNLAPHREATQLDYLKNRCSADGVRCLNRADVKVMCSWVLTAPRTLPTSKHDEFFEVSYDFMAERYGRENVISAYVHKDETQNHVHFAFVPIVSDKKKGGYKVSAKEAINKTELQTFHKALEQHLERHFGRTVGILNGATKDGNMNKVQLQENERLKKENRNIAVDTEYKLVQAREARQEYNTLAEQCATLESDLDALQSEIKKREKAAEQKLKEINAKYEVAAQELKNVLNKKARASEIRRGLFDRETQSYHANMLSSTRAIGSEAYENLQKAKKALEKANTKEAVLAEKEKEIMPLHETALHEYKQARELLEKQEKHIEQKAKEATEKHLSEAFKGVPDKRSQRLEQFCDEIRYKDGTTVLDRFKEQEKALEIQVRGSLSR